MEKKQTISSLQQKLQCLTVNANEGGSNVNKMRNITMQQKIQDALNGKLQLESDLKSRMEELANWQQKLCGMKQTKEKTVQANKDLLTELQGLKQIEMDLQQSAKSQTKMLQGEEQNGMEQNVLAGVGMKNGKSIDYDGTSDDSGIVTMNSDNSKMQDEMTNIS
jgi:hypothetical protein